MHDTVITCRDVISRYLQIDTNIFAAGNFHRRYTRFLAKHRTQLLIAAYFWSGFGRGFALGQYEARAKSLSHLGQV